MFLKLKNITLNTGFINGVYVLKDGSLEVATSYTRYFVEDPEDISKVMKFLEESH